MRVGEEVGSRACPRLGARRRAWAGGHHFEILMASLAGLLVEVSYTRIVSDKLFYYYTYLVIGLALLGIGAGGVLVAVSRRLRAAKVETVLIWSLVLGAISI